MGTAHLKLCPDILSEKLPIGVTAFFHGMLNRKIVIIKKVQHSHGTLSERGNLGGAYPAPYRNNFFFVEAQGSRICARTRLWGGLRAQIQSTAAPGQWFVYGPQDVVNVKRRFFRHEFPAGFIICGGHQVGGGVFIDSCQQELVQQDFGAFAVLPAEEGSGFLRKVA